MKVMLSMVTVPEQAAGAAPPTGLICHWMFRI
jgi:hypothetical protein